MFSLFEKLAGFSADDDRFLTAHFNPEPQPQAKEWKKTMWKFFRKHACRVWNVPT